MRRWAKGTVHRDHLGSRSMARDPSFVLQGCALRTSARVDFGREGGGVPTYPPNQNKSWTLSSFGAFTLTGTDVLDRTCPCSSCFGAEFGSPAGWLWCLGRCLKSRRSAGSTPEVPRAGSLRMGTSGLFLESASWGKAVRMKQGQLGKDVSRHEMSCFSVRHASKTEGIHVLGTSPQLCGSFRISVLDISCVKDVLRLLRP